MMVGGDLREDGKVEEEDYAWVFSTDSDSDCNMDRDSDVDSDSCGYDGTCLPDRPPRNFLPS